MLINRSLTQQDQEKQFELIQQAMSGSDTAMQSLVSFYKGTGLNVNPEDNSMTITVEGQVIPIKLGSQVTSGANLAAGLGINPEDYIEWAEGKGLDSTLMVDAINLQEKFSNVTGVKAEEAPIVINTAENVAELGQAKTVDLMGRDIPLSCWRS